MPGECEGGAAQRGRGRGGPFRPFPPPGGPAYWRHESLVAVNVAPPIRRFFSWRVRPSDVVRDLAVCATFGTLAGLGAGAHWFLDFFTHFPLHYLLVLLPATTLLVALRRPLAASICAACLLYNAAQLVPLFRAPPRAAAAAGSALRVLEINVLRENKRADQALQAIRDAAPDVVVALEVTPEWLERLAPLRQRYPHVVAEPQDDCFGLAVFSAYPVLAHRTLWLGHGWVPSLRVTLDVGGRPLDLLATHAVPPKDRIQTGARNDQLVDLAEEAKAGGRPLLLVGDLNATPWSPHFRRLVREGRLADSGRGFGLKGTWPSFAPAWLRIPIDHVLVSPHLLVRDRRTGRPFGSDHVPLLVDVSWADRQPEQPGDLPSGD